MRGTSTNRGSGTTWTTSKRYYNLYQGRYLSVDPVMGEEARPQTWNRYLYAVGNPLKWTDPTGETVSLSSLTGDQQQEVLQQLNAFTGNTYDVDKEGNLYLKEVGTESSKTATNFLNSAIGSSNTYSVRATNSEKSVKLGQATEATNDVRIDFDDFSGMKTGKVNPATINVGSVVFHELVHLHAGLRDPKGKRADLETGDVVDFVNRVRTERGFPLRGPAYAGKFGFGWRLKMNFIRVDPRKPEKIHYIKFRNR